MPSHRILIVYAPRQSSFQCIQFGHYVPHGTQTGEDTKQLSHESTVNTDGRLYRQNSNTPQHTPDSDTLQYGRAGVLFIVSCRILLFRQFGCLTSTSCIQNFILTHAHVFGNQTSFSTTIAIQNYPGYRYRQSIDIDTRLLISQRQQQRYSSMDSYKLIDNNSRILNVPSSTAVRGIDIDTEYRTE